MTDSEGSCAYIARKEDPSNWNGDDPGDWVLEEEVWECQHDTLDGEMYCAFHTDPEDVPDDIDEGDRFVKAVNESSTVDDEGAARQQKEFVGATFSAFDIEEAMLDAGDEHPIRLDHARFTCGVNAENAVFGHGVLAQRARFETGDRGPTSDIWKVSFKGVEFREGEVSFESAEFGEGKIVSFEGADFGDGEVSFKNAEFRKREVAFSRTEFGEGEVSFESAEFGEGKRVFFKSADFGDGEVSFKNAKFRKIEVAFNKAEFGEGEVSFESAEFGEEKVLFHKTDFEEGKVSFWSAKFGEGDVVFVDAEFGEGTVLFRSAEFGEGMVSFRSAEFGEGMVSFRSAEFGEGTVSFDRATVTGSLSFLDTRFDVESTVNFSDAELRDDMMFGFYEVKNDTYEHSLDFSGATFRRALHFYGGTDSTTGTEQSDSGEPRFDFVFAGEVNFSDATILGEADFSATRFPSDADFSGATLKNVDFSNADLTGTDNISDASFTGANLSGVNFSRAELAGASFERARLSRAELLGANFRGAKLYGALLGDARINRETDFWLGEDDTRREPDGSSHLLHALRCIKMTFRDREPYCSYDPRYRGSDSEQNLEKAGEVYATLETLARNNSLPGLASDCFLGRKDVQFREYWRDGNRGMVVRSLMPNLVARYGESPTRVLGTGAVTVLTCGLAYYAFNLVEHADSGDPATLFQSLYFSGLTFTTLGYGDFNPTNELGQVLAVAETSMGVVLLAILVFVFGRRATR